GRFRAPLLASRDNGAEGPNLRGSGRGGVCTSHVERTNLHIRMQMRRFTRLTNAFSLKRENLRAALALHFAAYNFTWMHSSIRMTPAMKAGIARKPWTMRDLLTICA